MWRARVFLAANNRHGFKSAEHDMRIIALWQLLTYNSPMMAQEVHLQK